MCVCVCVCVFVIVIVFYVTYWLLSAANTDIYIGLYEAISEWLEVVATVTLAVDERLLAPPGVDAARSAATTLR